MTKYVRLGEYYYDLEDASLSTHPEWCFHDGDRQRLIYSAEQLLNDLERMVSAPQVIYPVGPDMTKRIEQTKEGVEHL